MQNVSKNMNTINMNYSLKRHSIIDCHVLFVQRECEAGTGWVEAIGKMMMMMTTKCRQREWETLQRIGNVNFAMNAMH